MPKGVYARKSEIPSDLPVAPEPGADAMAEIAAMRAELAAEMEKAKVLTAKLETQTFVRSEVSEALRLQQEEAKRQAFGKREPTREFVMPLKPEGAVLVPMKLERHYCPSGYYEVVGYHKEAVFRKHGVTGQMMEIEPASFVAGQKKPPHVAGVGFQTKVWAGTVLNVTEAEAKTMRKAGIGSVELAD